jgi:hypothetical protein
MATRAAPPAFVPVSDCWKVVLNFHVSTAKMASILHVQGAWTNSEHDIGNDVATAWMNTTSITKLQTPQCTGDLVEVKKIDGVSSGVELSLPVFTNGVGAATNQPEAIQVAGLTTWRTGLAGRQHRGRTYIPGIEQGHINTLGTQWNSSFVTTGQACVTAFLSLIQASAHVNQLVVYSRWHNSMSPVTSAVFRNYFGTQRRRAESQE